MAVLAFRYWRWKQFIDKLVHYASLRLCEDMCGTMVFMPAAADMVLVGRQPSIRVRLTPNTHSVSSGNSVLRIGNFLRELNHWGLHTVSVDYEARIQVIVAEFVTNDGVEVLVTIHAISEGVDNISTGQIVHADWLMQDQTVQSNIDKLISIEEKNRRRRQAAPRETRDIDLEVEDAGG